MILIEPPLQQVLPGAVFTVSIVVSDIDALAGADVRLAIDPTILAVVDADGTQPGTQIATGPILTGNGPYQIFRNDAINATGLITYVGFKMNPVVPFSGVGVLASIPLRALGPGTSSIGFRYAKLVTRSGAEIPQASQAGTIVVSGEAQPATATPTVAPPTATPIVAAPTPTPIVAPPTPTPLPASIFELPSPTPVATAPSPSPTVAIPPPVAATVTPAAKVSSAANPAPATVGAVPQVTTQPIVTGVSTRAAPAPVTALAIAGIAPATSTPQTTPSPDPTRIVVRVDAPTPSAGPSISATTVAAVSAAVQGGLAPKAPVPAAGSGDGVAAPAAVNPGSGAESKPAITTADVLIGVGLVIVGVSVAVVFGAADRRRARPPGRQ